MALVGVMAALTSRDPCGGMQSMCTCLKPFLHKWSLVAMK